MHIRLVHTICPTFLPELRNGRGPRDGNRYITTSRTEYRDLNRDTKQNQLIYSRFHYTRFRTLPKGKSDNEESKCIFVRNRFDEFHLCTSRPGFTGSVPESVHSFRSVLGVSMGRFGFDYLYTHSGWFGPSLTVLVSRFGI